MTLSIRDLEALMDAGWQVPDKDRWKPRQSVPDDELAEEYRFLSDAGLTHQQIAQRLGLTPVHLTKRVNLLGLEPHKRLHKRVHKLIASGRTFMAEDICDRPYVAGGYIQSARRAGLVERAGQVKGAQMWRGVSRDQADA